MGLNAFWELFLGTFADFCRQLWLHHVTGTFFQQGIQFDTVDHVQWVQYVTFGLGHLVAVLVTDQTGYVNGFERNLWVAVFIFHEVHGHHDHACYPEEDDVETGYQHISRVECLQALGVFRPAQCAECPQRGAEPCVQYVIVLTQFQIQRQVVFFTCCVFIVGYVYVAFVIVEGWDTVTPPQLTGDTPVLNVAHPGVVHVLVLLRHKFDIAFLNSFYSGFSQRFSIGKPLVRQHRLDDNTTTVTVRYGHVVFFDLNQQVCGFEIGNDFTTCSETFHTTVFLRDGGVDFTVRCAIGIKAFTFIADICVVGQDVNHRQTATLADFVIVEVVRRGDFYATGAFFHIGVFVTHDWNAAANERQDNLFTDQVFVALIVRVYGNTGITQHGFRTCSTHNQEIFTSGCFSAISQRVTQVPHLAFYFFVLYFQIRDRGVQFRVPVHQTFATVNQTFVIQTDKDFLYRVVETGIHSETFRRPVN